MILAGHIFNANLIYCAQVFCLHICLCTVTTRMPGALGGHKRALGALEVELQVVTSYHVDTRNGTCGLCKNSQYSKPLSHLSSQETGILFVLFCALTSAL